MGPLTRDVMLAALSSLDEKLVRDEHSIVNLVMGGGGAMILAHGFPLGTTDIDAVPRGMDHSEIDRYVKEIAIEQGIPSDWLNPYFSTFSHTLPTDYGDRLIRVYAGNALNVDALGKEEMLIMKCFAHRRKDVGHARTLISGGADLDRVEVRIEELLQKRIPGAQQALDFFQEVLELEGR